ncbi:MAG: DUF3159 domain-containing protein [Cellulomonadaceae bacterium]|nr:DUF3159 domain-containing protein [Cellulomonadaceae bacterium]
MRALAGDDFSFADAIGGVRGLVESVVPGLVFVVAFLATRALVPSLVAASAVAVLAVVVRLVQRTPMTQAFSGLLGVGIGVLWAWRTGEAQNYFAGGLLANVAYLLLMAVSALVRWPVIGVVVSLLRSEPMTWRTDPAQAHLRRRYVWATWLWAAMFGLRLAVQVPFYLQGVDGVGALGTAKLAMGVPLTAVTVWLTWLLVASPGARAERRDRPRTPRR